MKLFFLGSFPKNEPLGAAAGHRRMIRDLGMHFSNRGHDLVVCSPFEGSIDLEILRGAAAANTRSRIEMHFPEAHEVLETVKETERELNLKIQRFAHPAMPDADKAVGTNGWLFSQLSALDSCSAVVAAGGRSTHSASMLLHLAEARRRPVIPLPAMGGAAAECYQRQRFTLLDRLGDLASWLFDLAPMEKADTVLDRLVSGAAASGYAGHATKTFFISYPRPRAADADLVETLLRRRNCTVLRDERQFQPDVDIVTSIDQAVARADVFIALYCADYACSPWCYDELDITLRRHTSGSTQIWLLDLDGTRMVHPEARGFPLQPCRTRENLVGSVLRLLEQVSANEPG